MGFSVAALGEEGGLFAADPTEDEEEEDDEEEVEAMDSTTRNIYLREKAARRRARRGGAYVGSQLFFRRFETFGRPADKDWVMALPGGETAVGCAVGRGWAAVVTSRRFLRLFTAGGVQGPVHWLSGDPVAVVGRDRFVAVFHHAAAGPLPDGTQALGYSVRDGVTGATVAEGDVAALSAGSELAWAGFTNTCALAAMDSAGMLSVLARGGDAAPGTSGNWMPVLDTLGLRRTKHDRHWPVEVNGPKLVCVPLRGGKEYPDAARRPVTTTLQLRVPMAMGKRLKT
jgi:chromosome transmission fidelity protein 4